MQVRPRRSVLYVPGANARAQEKARSLAVDGIILDLEDAVAPDAKTAAREQVLETLGAGGFGHREIIARVNALETPWGYDDLRALARADVGAVLLPKVESADMVRAAERVLRDAGARDDLALWCMMETPRGILRAEEIADSSPRVACLVMGTSDLANDLGAVHTPDRLAFLPSLGICLLAARAAGRAILDGVHLDLSDDAGFEAACAQGRALGFDGKTLIHPKTIETCNRAFAPAAEEVDWAERVIAAHAEATAKGIGVVLVDGKLVENLHVAQARRALAIHAAIMERG